LEGQAEIRTRTSAASGRYNQQDQQPQEALEPLAPLEPELELQLVVESTSVSGVVSACARAVAPLAIMRANSELRMSTLNLTVRFSRWRESNGLQAEATMEGVMR
jgi:hypothetical protein